MTKLTPTIANSIRSDRTTRRTSARRRCRFEADRLNNISNSYCPAEDPRSEIRNPKERSDFGFRISDFLCRSRDDDGLGNDQRAVARDRAFALHGEFEQGRLEHLLP